MTVPPDYARSTLLLRNGELRGLNEDDAALMIGVEITAQLPLPSGPVGSVVLAFGEVTEAEVIENGRRLVLTVEAGGRSCHACGRVYSDREATIQLATITELRAASRPESAQGVYLAMPEWARVCRDSASCFSRQIDTPSGDEVNTCHAGCQR